jgi:hypothetical protein
MMRSADRWMRGCVDAAERFPQLNLVDFSEREALPEAGRTGTVFDRTLLGRTAAPSQGQR